MNYDYYDSKTSFLIKGLSEEDSKLCPVCKALNTPGWKVDWTANVELKVTNVYQRNFIQYVDIPLCKKHWRALLEAAEWSKFSLPGQPKKNVWTYQTELLRCPSCGENKVNSIMYMLGTNGSFVPSYSYTSGSGMSSGRPFVQVFLCNHHAILFPEGFQLVVHGMPPKDKLPKISRAKPDEFLLDLSFRIGQPTFFGTPENAPFADVDTNFYKMSQE